MGDEYVYLSSTVKLDTPLNETLDTLSVSEGQVQPIRPIFLIYTFAMIEADIARLQDLAVNNHAKLSGQLILAQNTTNGVIKLKIQVSNTTAPCETCEIGINVKHNGGERKPTLKQADKIALITAFVDEQHRFPEADEVYREQNVGKFWQTISKNKKTYDDVAKHLPQ